MLLGVRIGGFPLGPVTGHQVTWRGSEVGDWRVAITCKPLTNRERSVMTIILSVNPKYDGGECLNRNN